MKIDNMYISTRCHYCGTTSCTCGLTTNSPRSNTWTSIGTYYNYEAEKIERENRLLKQFIGIYRLLTDVERDYCQSLIFSRDLDNFKMVGAFLDKKVFENLNLNKDGGDK